MLATAWARKGTREDFTRALSELNQALELDPRDYWSSVQRGVCQLELGNLVAAAGDFGNCIGLWPDFAWGYFNRGLRAGPRGQEGRGDRGLLGGPESRPAFVPAYINRGLAHLELKQHSQALADFDKAVALGQEGPSVEAGRGMALEAMGRLREADSAFELALARAETLDRSGSAPDSSGPTVSPSPGVCPRKPDECSRRFSAQARAIPRPSTVARCLRRARAVRPKHSVILISLSREPRISSRLADTAR